MKLRAVVVTRPESLRQLACGLRFSAQRDVNFAVHFAPNGNAYPIVRERLNPPSLRQRLGQLPAGHIKTQRFGTRRHIQFGMAGHGIDIKILFGDLPDQCALQHGFFYFSRCLCG
ncbi:hypothetical protein D3C79_616550 [compost metagenome]